jgi:hypothetical protein
MSLDDQTLDQLVSMEAEAFEYPNWKDAHATKKSHTAASEFDDAVYSALYDWVEAGGAPKGYDPKDADPEEAADELMDAEGAYLVFMTLEGAGVGIWDGRWDKFYSREEIEKLKKFLKERLSGHITAGVFHPGPYDELRSALEEDAYNTGGGKESDDDDEEEESED